MRRLSCFLSLIASLLCVLSNGLFGAEPRVTIVSAKNAPSLEQSAAYEVAALVDRVCKVTYAKSDTLPPSGDVILVGTPETNPAVKEVVGTNWPKLSEQGHLLKSAALKDRQALIVGGGSPLATLWAAYELGYQHGVRSMLFGDVFPPEPQELRLTGFDLVLEPTQPVRAFRVLDPLVTGTEFWSEREHSKLIGQLHKLKFNAVIVAPYAWQPFEDYQFGGLKKTSVATNFGLSLTVAPTDAGRAVFKGAKVFENPVFEIQNGLGRTQNGRFLLTAIRSRAQELGMTSIVETRPCDVPAEFAAAVPHSKLSAPSDLSLSVNQQTQQLIDFNAARWQGLWLHHRSFGFIRIDATAENRFEPALRSHAKLVRALPGMEADAKLLPSFSDAQPSGFDLAEFTKHLPKNLTQSQAAAARITRPIEKLASWQTVLPVVWTDRTDELIALSTRTPEVGMSIEISPFNGLSPEVHRLSRALFGAKQSVEEAQLDLLTPVAGREGAERLSKSYGLIAKATKLLQAEPGFAPPLPGVVLKHFHDPAPAPVWWKDAKDSYLAAMNEFYRGNQRARAADKPFARYGAKKCEFAFQYFNCIEAVKAAGVAQRKGEKDAAIEQLEKAVEALYSGIDALREVARDPHDIGVIAALNEFGYRPLKKQLQALTDAAP